MRVIRPTIDAWENRHEEQTEAVRARNVSFVYFVKSGAYVKIGVTRDFSKRLRHLQNGNPKPLKCLCLVDGSQKMEKALHAKFAKERALNEWFRLTPEIATLIDQLSAGATLKDLMG